MPRQNTKERILAGAAKVFAEQGFASTTISQVARESGVSEASIYEYFKGKEDLLLTIPSEKIAEVASLIEDHLFGIKSALGQLRKFVWVYVRHMTVNPTHARIALVHLKTNKGFMGTDAYRVVQQFYGKITEIIELGQKTGEIKPHMSPYIARALIVGAIEHIAVRWLLKDCSYDLLEQLEQVYDLIEEAIKARPVTVNDQSRGLVSTNDPVPDATGLIVSGAEQVSTMAKGGLR